MTIDKQKLNEGTTSGSGVQIWSPPIKEAISPMENHFFVCDCFSDEHNMRFIYDPDENELYANFFLNTYDGFFKRLVTAVKYLFGYKCKYGQWDSWILGRNDAERLSALLERVKNANKS